MQIKKGRNFCLSIIIAANGVLNFAVQANAAFVSKANLDIRQVCAVSNIALSQIWLKKAQKCNRHQHEIILPKKKRINQHHYYREKLSHNFLLEKKRLLKKTSILDRPVGRTEQFKSKYQIILASIADTKPQIVYPFKEDTNITKILRKKKCINTDKEGLGIDKFTGKFEIIYPSLLCNSKMTQTIFSDSEIHKKNQLIGSVSNSPNFYLLSQTSESPPQSPTESPVQGEQNPIQPEEKPQTPESPVQGEQNPIQPEEKSQSPDPPPVEGESADINNNPSPIEIEKKLNATKSEKSKKIEQLLQLLEKNKQSTVNSTKEKEIQNNANTDIDIELGEFRVLEKPLEQLPVPQQPVAKFKPIGYLLARFGYFQTSNIFSAEMDPETDGLFYSGLTLSSVPLRLGRQTYMRGSIDGNIFRYINQSDFNYNQLRFNLGIFQRLSSKMYAELGWRNQQLFYSKDSDRFNIASGDKFLNENAFRLSLGRRDTLSKKLILDSFYELRVSLTDLPAKRDRIINYLSVFLNYYLQKSLQVGFGYQFNYSDFTERIREDQYNRFLANLNYKMSDHSNLSLQTGISLGHSTQENIDFDGWFLSINYNLELGKF